MVVVALGMAYRREVSAHGIIEQLDTEFGAALVAAARGLDPLHARSVLAKQFPHADPELLQAASRQAHLAAQAEPRFGNRAWEVLWTTDGLAQASHPGVAQYRARRLAALGVRSAADLTCGLGIDLLAMSDAGIAVVGIESDVEIAELARRNTRRHSTLRHSTLRHSAAGSDPDRPHPDPLGGTPRDRPAQSIGRIDIRVGSCTDESTLASLPAAEAWFIDPARRGAARRQDGSHIRLDDPESWSPPWSWVRELRHRADIVVAKTAPGIPHALLSDANGEWVSLRGQLREVTAWWGVGETGARTAVILAADGSELLRVPASGVELDAIGLPAPGTWLLDPDPAIVRAHVLAEFGVLVGASLVDPQLAYLALPHEPQATPATALNYGARRWQVVYSGAYRPAALRTICADLGITRVDVTGRGRSLPAPRVAKELHLAGGPGQHATLITMALGGARRTAVVLGIPDRTR